jgi:hypothetical protein
VFTRSKHRPVSWARWQSIYWLGLPSSHFL